MIDRRKFCFSAAAAATMASGIRTRRLGSSIGPAYLC